MKKRIAALFIAMMMILGGCGGSAHADNTVITIKENDEVRMENGHRVWKQYETLFVDGEDFDEIGAAFENTYSIHKEALGNGVIRLMKQRDLVDFAVRWIEENRK